MNANDRQARCSTQPGEGEAALTRRAASAPLWRREMPLDGSAGDSGRERWLYRNGPHSESFELTVKTGKPLDVLALKGASLEETRTYAVHLQATAAQLYAYDAPHHVIDACPSCNTPSGEAGEAAIIFGITYRQCAICGHGFVREQPSAEALNRVFVDSELHAQTYIDRDSAEFRIENIVGPKLDWLVGVYREIYGNAPGSLLDVGAGGGHFVAATRRRGIPAEGYELSRASRKFAEELFDLSLREGNFLTERSPKRVDVVTMWGLLEYTPAPRDFLDAARKNMSTEGLLIVEVPRLNCLGTAVQRLSPDTVARHLDPTTHVNTFTDSSLATALVLTGFRPVAAWYFGMDAYELLIQQALRLDQDCVLGDLADWLPELQSCLDQGRLCDDIVMAAVPA